MKFLITLRDGRTFTVEAPTLFHAVLDLFGEDRDFHFREVVKAELIEV